MQGHRVSRGDQNVGWVPTVDAFEWLQSWLLFDRTGEAHEAQWAGGDRRGQEGTHSEPVGLSGRLAQWRAEAEAATQSLSPWGSQRPQAGHHK